MISSLSFATFAVSPDKAELRLRLSFTLILTSVTFKYVITQSLPKISYLTYMDKYVLMSLAILCIISVWHAIVTLLDPEHIATKYGRPANLFDLYGLQQNKSFLPLDTAVNSTNTTQNETVSFLKEHASPDNGFADNLLAFLLGSEQMDQADQIAESKTSTDSGNLSTPVGDQRNTTVARLSHECSLDNKMACEEWKRVQIVEQHVFTSFVIIYVIAHAVFIFWLYFDASKRRREMRQKDKDYRDFLRRHQQWQKQSLRQRDLHVIQRSSLHT
ncbi:hypothetical protein AHF37_10107 [Paragonimus kellicotti]|nr:hypothetical protein AHF37_10107 [Paragonimus kellicotti]